MVEIWNPYHDVFDDSDDVSPEEDYLNVAESYELTTPQGVPVILVARRATCFTLSGIVLGTLKYRTDLNFSFKKKPFLRRAFFCSTLFTLAAGSDDC